MKYLLCNQGIKCVFAYFWRLQFVLSGFAQHPTSHLKTQIKESRCKLFLFDIGVLHLCLRNKVFTISQTPFTKSP